MTDLATTNVQQSAWAEYAGAGQEDVDARDIRLPRLKLDKTGVFINSITKENLGPNIRTVVLGCVKQRTFFPAMSGDGTGQAPICKSNDFETGFPTDPFTGNQKTSFPWGEAGLLQSDHPLNAEFGRVLISCEKCALKEWRTKTFKDNGRPYCAAMHTYALLYETATGDWVPAVMSIKGASLGNSSSYLGAFAMQGKRPYFTAYTQLQLTAHANGDVNYATVSFHPDMAVLTPQENWASYNQQTQDIRDLLRKAPRAFENDAAGNLVAPETLAAEKAAEATQSQNNWDQQVAAQGPAPAWAQYVQDEPANGQVSEPVSGPVITAPANPPAPVQQPAPAQQRPVAAAPPAPNVAPPAPAPQPVSPPPMPAAPPAPATVPPPPPETQQPMQRQDPTGPVLPQAPQQQLSHPAPPQAASDEDELPF